jgi:hypothetical protein
MQEHLLDAVTQWERERSALDDKIRVGHELLDLLDPLPADMLAELLPGVRESIAAAPAISRTIVVDTTPVPKKKGGGQVACPDCGIMQGSAAGLSQHRKHKHPGSAAKPIAVPPPAERPHISPKPSVPGKVFACETCEHEEPNIGLLQRHTSVEHRRGLNREERTPVEPFRAAS